MSHARKVEDRKKHPARRRNHSTIPASSKAERHDVKTHLHELTKQTETETS